MIANIAFTASYPGAMWPLWLASAAWIFPRACRATATRVSFRVRVARRRSTTKPKGLRSKHRNFQVVVSLLPTLAKTVQDYTPENSIGTLYYLHVRQTSFFEFLSIAIATRLATTNHQSSGDVLSFQCLLYAVITELNKPQSALFVYI